MAVAPSIQIRSKATIRSKLTAYPPWKPVSANIACKPVAIVLGIAQRVGTNHPTPILSGSADRGFRPLGRGGQIDARLSLEPLDYGPEIACRFDGPGLGLCLDRLY